MGLCQSLQQRVFVPRAIVEGPSTTVDEEKERERDAKHARKFEDPCAPPKRSSLLEIRRTASAAEKAPVPISATQFAQPTLNPLPTAVSSASISHDHSLMGSGPLVPTHSDSSSATLERNGILLWRHVWLNEHIAEVFQLLGASDFLREQRELDDVEEFVVEFVGFVQIFLLHLVTNVTVFAVGR
jgi:hypothetical protein